jgi:hypothetical protein
MTFIESKVIEVLKDLGVNHTELNSYDGAFCHELTFKGITLQIKVLDIILFYYSTGVDEKYILDRSVKEILLTLLNKKQEFNSFENFYERNL